MPLTKWNSDTTSAAPGKAGWELMGMTGMGRGVLQGPQGSGRAQGCLQPAPD